MKKSGIAFLILIVLAALIAYLYFYSQHRPEHHGKKQAPTPASSQNLLQYGKMCADAIASIPAFSCLDGEVIPITVNGSAPATYTPNMDCDKPPLLPLSKQGQCIPYSRVLNFSKGPNQIVVGCRRKVIRDKASPYFDEIDIISHNIGTGGTCWFQALASDETKGLDGTRVPSPDQATPPPGYPDPMTFWQSPAQVASENCGGCHDNDPFMYSPYMGQVWNKVPTDPFGWYQHLGPDFAGWKTISLSTPNNACVGCHRIGLSFTSGQGTREATAMVPIKNADEWAKQYPQSHWMPPDNFHSQLQWQTIYQKSVQALLACHDKPALPDCIVTPIKSIK